MLEADLDVKYRKSCINKIVTLSARSTGEEVMYFIDAVACKISY